LFHGDVGRAEARRQDRRQKHVVFLACLDDPVAPFERDLQRLLDEQMFSGRRRRQRRLQMGSARRADRHDPNVVIGQHVVEA